MMNRFRLLRLAAACALCACVAVAGLPLEQLPANTRWVLQCDVQALRDAPPGKELLATLTEAPPGAEWRALEAVAPLSSPTTVIASGSAGVMQGAVIYLYGRWEPRKLSAALAASHPFTTTKYARHLILHWEKGGASQEWPCTSACILSTNLVLLAVHGAGLQPALDVLDGKAPALASVPRFQHLPAAENSALLQVVAVDLKELLADIPQAAMLPPADTLRLTLQADRQGVHLKGVIQAATADGALQVQMALTGLQAVALFQGAKEPDLAALARTARISVDGRNVSVSLSAPLDALPRLLAHQKPARGAGPN